MKFSLNGGFYFCLIQCFKNLKNDIQINTSQAKLGDRLNKIRKQINLYSYTTSYPNCKFSTELHEIFNSTIICNFMVMVLYWNFRSYDSRWIKEPDKRLKTVKWHKNYWMVLKIIVWILGISLQYSFLWIMLNDLVGYYVLSVIPRLLVRKDVGKTIYFCVYIYIVIFVSHICVCVCTYERKKNTSGTGKCAYGCEIMMGEKIFGKCIYMILRGDGRDIWGNVCICRITFEVELFVGLLFILSE